MKTRPFGVNSRGEKATLYTLENKNGMVAQVTDLGATLYSLLVPHGKGEKVDVVLAYEDALAYEQGGGTFLGATVGRNANRIGGAAFTLNGKEYRLDKNDGDNNLHSGLDFHSFRVWQVTAISDSSITFLLHSPDGDQGYPGAVDLQVTYTLTDDNSLRLDYEGTPDQDTVINLTNHSYFNLNGHGSGPITGHEVWVDADRFTRADAASIPTGELLEVAGTPMDFRTPKTVGRDIDADYEAVIYGKGYDHNWCLNNGGEFAKVAWLRGETTGITMEVYTDLPGVQIYTGNFLVEQAGKDGVVYNRRHGICFETQYYPDTPNKPHFPSCIFKAGQCYKTSTAYRFV